MADLSAHRSEAQSTGRAGWKKADYHSTGADPTSASFVRTLSGDELRVDLKIVVPGPPLRVRMTFTATPD